jgi:hypothetical protein
MPGFRPRLGVPIRKLPSRSRSMRPAENAPSWRGKGYAITAVPSINRPTPLCKGSNRVPSSSLLELGIRSAGRVPPEKSCDQNPRETRGVENAQKKMTLPAEYGTRQLPARFCRCENPHLRHCRQLGHQSPRRPRHHGAGARSYRGRPHTGLVFSLRAAEMRESTLQHRLSVISSLPLG